MAESEARVKITADSSQVKPGVDEAKAAVQGLGASVAAASAQMRGSFATVSTSVREMGVTIRETVGMVGELREAMMAFGEAMIAAFAIEKIADWAREMGEAAEKTKHTAEIFGMTVPQVQGLQAVASATGMSIDTLTKGMGILDKNMVAAASGAGTAAVAFKAIGISAGDGKTQMELLLSIADKFKAMEDGPKKVALAMQLFGKAGKEMIPFLDQGAAGIERLDQKSQQYAAGVMLATNANKELREWLDQVNERGMALAESTNESKIAWQGLSNVLTDAFAPALKAAVDGFNGIVAAIIASYREGGVAKDVFDAVASVMHLVSEAFQAASEIIVAFGQSAVDVGIAVGGNATEEYGNKVPKSLHTMTEVVNFIRSALIMFKDMAVAVGISVGVAFVQLKDLIAAACKVIYDALTFKWGAIESDWHAGMAAIAADAEKQAGRVKAAWEEATAAFHGTLKLPGGDAKSGMPETKGAGGDFDPDLTKPKKEKKPKAEKSRASDWEADLEDQKTSFAMQQQAQGTFEQWSLQSDVNYWSQILARSDLSTKERMAVDQKYLAAIKANNEQKLAAIDEAARKELDAAAKNHAERISILQQEAAQVAVIYGAQSKQYEAVQHRIVEETRAAEAQQVQIADIAAKEKIKLAGMDLAAQEASAKAREAAGLESKGRLLIQEQQYLAQKYALDMQALAQEEALAKDEPVKLAQINAQKMEVEKQYQNQLRQLQQQASLQRTLVERTAINSISQSWSTALSQMATGQRSFTKGLQSMYMGIVNMISTALAGMIEKWMQQQLTAMILGRAIQTTTGIAQVTSNAAIAGSAAYAATAAIPIIGPELAPAAAATAFAGAMSFAGLASAKGGWGDVPFDGAMAMLHKNEMVLPADIATPLRANLKGGANDNAAAGGGASGRGGGDTHIHYAPNITSARITPQDLTDHADHLYGMMRQGKRDGKF